MHLETATGQCVGVHVSKPILLNYKLVHQVSFKCRLEIIQTDNFTNCCHYCHYCKHYITVPTVPIVTTVTTVKGQLSTGI